MSRIKIRKCQSCKKFFKPDPRNLTRQHFCSEMPCRAASKKTAQQRWLHKPENQGYFRGSAAVQRVQEWRKKHPGYSKAQFKPKPLQDALITQPTEIKENSSKFVPSPLQDVLNAQPSVLIGLIAKFTGSTLQDDIVKTASQLKNLGADLLSGVTPCSTQNLCGLSPASSVG